MTQIGLATQSRASVQSLLIAADDRDIRPYWPCARLQLPLTMSASTAAFCLSADRWFNIRDSVNEQNRLVMSLLTSRDPMTS